MNGHNPWDNRGLCSFLSHAHQKYDGLGRIKTKIVRNGGLEEPFDDDEVAEDDAEYQGELNAISYEYLPGKEANATTSLISKITHSAVNTELNYEYDDVGNITKETADLGGNMNQYEYDKLGQLIRANVRNDNTIRESGAEGTENAQGTTWVYEYDLGGNILKKKAYIRTTGEVTGEPVKTILYEYNNSNWADQMTAYGEEVVVDDGTGNGGTTVTTDMKPVTYDAIGNPLEYDGWNYTWRAGRRLMKMANQSENKVLEFKYNLSGLRTQKKVTESGTTTTTDYFLHGKLLTHMTVAKGSGSSADKEAVHFYYDAQSKPIMMRVGIEEETAKYYTFVTNLQGDILGLLDRNQDLVVEYKYDPWGKFVDAICESEHEMLAKLNPFRYRGYVYDEETGLYYLRSRYYNPEWCRFINEDSLIGKIGALLGHNVFAYCNNSPVLHEDPNGLLSDAYGGGAAYGSRPNETASRTSFSQGLAEAFKSFGKWLFSHQRYDNGMFASESELRVGYISTPEFRIQGKLHDAKGGGFWKTSAVNAYSTLKLYGDDWSVALIGVTDIGTASAHFKETLVSSNASLYNARFGITVTAAGRTVEAGINPNIPLIRSFPDLTEIVEGIRGLFYYRIS